MPAFFTAAGVIKNVRPSLRSGFLVVELLEEYENNGEYIPGIVFIYIKWSDEIKPSLTALSRGDYAYFTGKVVSLKQDDSKKKKNSPKIAFLADSIHSLNTILNLDFDLPALDRWEKEMTEKRTGGIVLEEGGF